MMGEVKPLDPRDSEQVQQIVVLHSLLLPDSPVARIGPLFMRKFYYRKLVEDGLIKVDFCSIEGKSAGFIAYTKYASTFMASGFRCHWLHLGGLLTASVLRRPSLIAQICGVATTMLRRKWHPSKACEGEILSFGVLPEYRNPEFIRRTGRRVSLELFESAKEFFERAEIASFRMLVQADNREALFFYHALGCKFRKLEEADGKIIEVIYSFSDQREQAARTALS